jgi:hypothetical protein
MEEITDLFGDERISDLDRAFATDADLDRKYRENERSYLVRAEAPR